MLDNVNIFVFGNGNLDFDNFLKYYYEPIIKAIDAINPQFTVCEFRGTDTLIMELLKSLTPKVTVLHMGEKPRYLPDKFKTYVSQWKIKGGFINDKERDLHAINLCTHFLAFDLNSDEIRKSGTLKNIEFCFGQKKIDLRSLLL